MFQFTDSNWMSFVFVKANLAECSGWRSVDGEGFSGVYIYGWAFDLLMSPC